MSPPARDPKAAPLGIIAGAGELPHIAAAEALARGESVRIFHFTDQIAPDLAPISERVVVTRLYSSVFRALRRHQIQRVLLIGKATRDLLFDRPRFDLRTLWLLLRMRSQSDTNLYAAVSGEIKKRGMVLVSQLEYLQSQQLAVGRYGPRLKRSAIKDIEFGLRHASVLNQLDVGQSVVVGQLSVLALEAAEGTDECILRGGGLFRRKGAIVCKLPKSDHDLRFDIPTIGSNTIQSMMKSGCRAIAFRSDCTIIVDPPTLVESARQAGVTLLALPSPAGWSRTVIEQVNRTPGKVK
ncbi:MAG: UDP-2,3-diacylglucosamine diphosphatase LpxI [Leptospiraceae bacterium]|nr:UDP-2,3-diacylglucosamine diphosphatase LpxI [Leptospiraceae bacterium]